MIQAYILHMCSLRARTLRVSIGFLYMGSFLKNPSKVYPKTIIAVMYVSYQEVRKRFELFQKFQLQHSSCIGLIYSQMPNTDMRDWNGRRYVPRNASLGDFVVVRTSQSVNLNNCPTRCDCRQLYMFRLLTPIIRGSYNCNYSFWWIRKTNQMSLFVYFISLLIVAQHVSGNHVPIIRS